MTDPKTTVNHPRSVWIDEVDSHAKRNSFVLFRMDVHLDTAPEEAVLDCFADTRYRLRVNGNTVGFGPARFYPAHTEHDRFDLVSQLRIGDNRIEVEVWAARSNNFQSVCALPMFWANGQIVANGSQVSLATPGQWQGVELSSVAADAIPLSFALGPVEIRDLSGDNPSSGFQPVIEVETPHATPVPRSIPEMISGLRDPQTLLYAGAGANNGEFHPGCFQRFEGTVNSFDFSCRRTAIYHTCIHSPCEQTVTGGTLWDDHFLNGARIPSQPNKHLGNRSDKTLQLKEGWNYLSGNFLVIGDVAGITFGLQRNAGLRIAVQPDDQSPAAFSVRFVEDSEDASKLAAALSEAPLHDLSNWKQTPADSSRLAPSRIVAWETPVDDFAPRPMNNGETIEVTTGNDGVAIVALDFFYEIFGRIEVSVEAGKAVTVDVSYDEFLRQDNLVALYRAHWLINSTDRYVCPAGSTAIQGFHNRGGRYVQLNLRAEPGTSIRLSNISVREFKTPTGELGSFQCSDPFWNALWETGCRTLHASLEDVWSDSPWREQGCYLGDSLVQFHAHTCLSNDHRLPARILRLFAESQRPDGQICGVVPAAMDRAHPDFTLIFIRFLKDYFASTGDAALVAELWPTVMRIIDSDTWIAGQNGLFRTTGGPVFIDWSTEKEARQGFSSVLNILYFDALNCAAAMAPLANCEPQDLYNRASALKTAIDTHLWNEKSGRYRCTILEDGTVVEGRALHANTLALARGLTSDERSDQLLDWLLAELEDNAGKIIRCREAQTSMPRNTSGQLEFYFLFYLFEALGEHGRTSDILPIVDDMWGLMLRNGATTFWESVIQSWFNEGSRCHSWAVAPMITAIRSRIGYRIARDGQPNAVVIQPDPGDLTEMNATVPHPRGPISINWVRDADNFRLSVTHPVEAEVTCLCPTGIDASNFELELNPAE